LTEVQQALHGGAPPVADPGKPGLDVDATEALGLSAKPLSPSRLAWRRFRRHKIALVSAIILWIITLMCVFAPLLSKYEKTQTGTLKGVRLPHGPTDGHWMGVDEIGRDLWTRVLYGGRISLAVGVGVALAASIAGATIGVIAGWYGRTVDTVLMRVTDLFLAIPLIVILIIGSQIPARQSWSQAFMGKPHSLQSVIVLLALFFWMPIARVIRGLVLSLKEKEFIEAARAAGASNARIMFRHLLPNCTGQIIINTTLAVAVAILTESALSFLGYGIDPVVEPTWGNLLTKAQGQMDFAPYLVWFPGIAIVLVVLAVNFIGDGLRDALDPKQLSV
jgi:peptide/nickel transport system permease protein